MTGNETDLPENVPPAAAPAGLDTGVAHIARVYNYWLGGKDNYAADRAAARQVMAAYPSISVGVRAQRAFLGRAVQYLTAGAGMRQFLDIGTGLPSADNTHEVAQRVAPESRIVYADNDPIVLAHARALLTSDPRGSTDYLDADLRDITRILDAAARTLDFSEPVAVLLLGILHCIPDQDDPWAIVARLMGEMPSGSHLVVAHPASDVDTAATSDAANRLNRTMAEQVTLRSHDEVRRLFDGLELLEPGVVQLHRWRPGAGDVDAQLELASYGAVGRKR